MLAETSCSNYTLSEFSLDFFKRVFIVFKHALSNCALIYPKQERIETNGDGVKQGYPPKTFRRGLGAQMFNGERICPPLNIFAPSPFVSELHANSCNTRSEGASCSGNKQAAVL